MTLHLQPVERLYVVAAKSSEHGAGVIFEPKIAFWSEEEASAFLALHQELDPHGQGPGLTYIAVQIARFHITQGGAHEAAR